MSDVSDQLRLMDSLMAGFPLMIAVMLLLVGGAITESMGSDRKSQSAERLGQGFQLVAGLLMCMMGIAAASVWLKFYVWR